MRFAAIEWRTCAAERVILRFADHGPIFLEGGVIPTWANSLVVGKDGYVYFLANLPKGYRPSGSTDLMRVRDPHAEKA